MRIFNSCKYQKLQIVPKDVSLKLIALPPDLRFLDGHNLWSLFRPHLGTFFFSIFFFFFIIFQRNLFFGCILLLTTLQLYKQNFLCFNIVSSQTELQGALQNMRKFKQMCDVLKNEKENMEKSKQRMLAQIDDHQSKIDKLTTVNAESVRQKEHTEEEKVRDLIFQTSPFNGSKLMDHFAGGNNQNLYSSRVR